MYLYLNKQGPQVFPNIYDKIYSYFQTRDKHFSDTFNFYALQLKYLHKKSDKQKQITVFQVNSVC